jgi:hypothetical protein
VRKVTSKLRFGLQYLSLGTIDLIRAKDFWRIVGVSNEASLLPDDIKHKPLHRIVVLLSRIVPQDEQGSDMYDAVSNMETSITKGRPSATMVYDYVVRHKGYDTHRASMVSSDMRTPLLRLQGSSLFDAKVGAEWVHPSAKAGLGLSAMGVHGPDPAMVRAMRGLQDKQIDMLHPLGFQWIRDAQGNAKSLSLEDIEQCLAGFSVYRKNAATKTARRKFVTTPPDWTPRSVTMPLYGSWSEPWNGRMVICNSS